MVHRRTLSKGPGAAEGAVGVGGGPVLGTLTPLHTVLPSAHTWATTGKQQRANKDKGKTREARDGPPFLSLPRRRKELGKEKRHEKQVEARLKSASLASLFLKASLRTWRDSTEQGLETKKTPFRTAFPAPGSAAAATRAEGSGGLHGNVDVRDPGPGTPPPAPARRPGAAPAPICGSWDARGVGAAPCLLTCPVLATGGGQAAPSWGEGSESDAGGDEPRPPPPPSQTSVCLPPLRSTTEGGGL
ncbi:uncharacterized protein LOC131499214 [Neofelis nebulosa]|uniref:uncharacterized protein LOC131499214 n=1 Tax=Neofelis nebulosa TaxID=61452 RepID=UPI00272A7C94|nr:uncharacterized protein LOC131499214 [Neofelis nebulosa]